MRIVLKIGGSLIKYPRKLKELCKVIGNLHEKFNIIVVPGGDGFADLVRKYYKIFNLSDENAHWMAILGMDQYGYLLNNLIPYSKIVDNIDYIDGILKNRYIPIILSYNILKTNEILPYSWDVTSDSIALHLATIIKASKLILIKDVDGIYDRGKILSEVDLNWLANNESCIDRYYPILARRYNISTYVVNGLYPLRLMKILHGEKTICTVIKTY